MTNCIGFLRFFAEKSLQNGLNKAIITVKLTVKRSF
jgi:hypothetical protein